MTDIQDKTNRQVKVKLPVVLGILLLVSAITAVVLSVPLFSLYRTSDMEHQIEKTSML